MKKIIILKICLIIFAIAQFFYALYYFNSIISVQDLRVLFTKYGFSALIEFSLRIVYIIISIILIDLLKLIKTKSN